jgi:hypothetical protein
MQEECGEGHTIETPVDLIRAPMEENAGIECRCEWSSCRWQQGRL